MYKFFFFNIIYKLLKSTKSSQIKLQKKVDSHPNILKFCGITKLEESEEVGKKSNNMLLMKLI